jgi:hypothetical protein
LFMVVLIGSLTFTYIMFSQHDYAFLKCGRRLASTAELRKSAMLVLYQVLPPERRVSRNSDIQCLIEFETATGLTDRPTARSQGR